jgi:hypothetical protein
MTSIINPVKTLMRETVVMLQISIDDWEMS